VLFGRPSFAASSVVEKARLAEQDDDLRPELVAERLELLRLAHDEHVARLVVGRRRVAALVCRHRTGH